MFDIKEIRFSKRKGQHRKSQNNYFRLFVVYKTTKRGNLMCINEKTH